MEKEAFVVKNTGNIKKNLQKSSEVAPLDGILGNEAWSESSVVFMYHSENVWHNHIACK